MPIKDPVLEATEVLMVVIKMNQYLLLVDLKNLLVKENQIMGIEDQNQTLEMMVIADQRDHLLLKEDQRRVIVDQDLILGDIEDLMKVKEPQLMARTDQDPNLEAIDDLTIEEDQDQTLEDTEHLTMVIMDQLVTKMNLDPILKEIDDLTIEGDHLKDIVGQDPPTKEMATKVDQDLILKEMVRKQDQQKATVEQ